MLGPQASYVGSFILFIKALCFTSSKNYSPQKACRIHQDKDKGVQPKFLVYV